MIPRNLSRSLAVLAGLLIAAVSLAQQAVSTPPTAGSSLHRNPVIAPAAPSFGPVGLSYVRVTGTEFFGYTGGGYVATGGDLGRYPVSDSGMDAGLHVPSGAVIDYLELDACDTNVANDITLYILDCGPLAAGCLLVPTASVSSTGATGCAAYSVSGIGYTVSNTGASLDLEAIFGVANDSSLKIMSAVVGYRLQVSPAPLSATFTDVFTSDFGFQFIEAFNAAGITVGCDTVGPRFCPDNNVTRREMAIFFAKALGLHFSN